MMRLDTKEKRLEARKFYFKEGATEINLPEYELQAYIKDEPNYYTLVLFLGTAGKPTMNYYYRTIEARDMALHKAIEDQMKRMEYKAQRKAENKGNLTGAAATAKAIKARLKAEFSGVKFSVKSSNYSMGNSVSISWTDGPLYEQVDAITRQYQYGHFDGMTDSYEHRDINPVLDCPGAKYVNCNRALSPEYKAQIQEVLEREFVPDQWGEYAHYKYVEAEKIMLGITQEPEEAQESEISVEPETIEPQKVEKPSNVLDITARIKQRQEREEADKAFSTFTAEYLPYFKADEIEAIMTAPTEKQMDIIMAACMRVDLERSRA